MNKLFLMMFGGSTWRGALVNDPAFVIARTTTTAVNKNTALDLQIKATRTTGVAPLGVVFDAITDSTFYGVSRPLHQLSFWWDFGDVGATFQNIHTDHPMGNDANRAMGAYTGHVFTEGVYTVKCYCYDHATGNIGYAETEIISTNIDAAFPASQTIYLDPTGIWANSPAGANQVSTWAAAKTAMQVTGDRRLIVDYGAIIEVDSEIDFRRSGTFRIHPVGNPANALPEFRPKTGATLNSGMFYIRAGNLNKDIAFTEIFGRGDYDPITGTGEDYDTDFINVLESDFVTVWRCKGRGLNDNFVLGGNDGTFNKGGHVVQDNDFSDWKNFGSSGHYYDSVYRGNSVKQNPLAVSGLGGKGESGMIYSAVGDGVTVTYTHGIDMLGDAAKNLAACKRDRTTGAVTVLTSPADYTFTETTVTYTVAPTTNEDAYIYFRRWADHGSIRLYNCQRQAVTHNDFESYTGWSTAGAPAGEGAIQPTIRYNSETRQHASGVINSNRLKGGFTVLHCGDANGDSGLNYAIDCVIEQNHITCDNQTREAIGANQPGLTVRNNVVFMPDVPESTAFRKLQHIVTYAAWSSSVDQTAKDQPVRIYNNTLIDLQTTANGAEDIDAVAGLASEVGAITPTDLQVGNNLVHYPQFTPPHADVTPINETTGQPQQGSAAINAGTQNVLVWDDFAGLVRGSNNTLGAYNEAEVASQTLTLDAVDSYISLPARTYIAGEKILVRYSATGNTTYSTLISRDSVRFYSSSRIRWDAGSTTIDGVVITSATAYPEIEDGLPHDLVHTLASNTNAGYVMNIGSTGSTEFWGGVIEKVQILDASDAVIDSWTFNNGSITVVEDDAAAGKFATLTGVDVSNWV